MRVWFGRHRIVAALVGTLTALVVIEAIRLAYYLNSWLTLPLL
jgi:hypothetical protein